jgi:ribosomal protein L44E
MENNTINIGDNELQEEVTKITKEYKLTFDCPHCHKEINENFFDEKSKAFKLINEKVRIMTEFEVNSRKNFYKQQ